MIIKVDNLNKTNCRGCPLLQEGMINHWICEAKFIIKEKYNKETEEVNPIRPRECREKQVIYINAKRGM